MRKFRTTLLAYAMLSPAMLILGIFGLFPLGYAFYVSLHKWKLNPGEFVGLANYAKALEDPRFLLGLKITAFHALYAIPLQLGLSLILAYMLHQNLRFRGGFRTLFFLPYVTPLVATAMIFKILLSSRDEAPANRLVSWLGLPVQKWLDEPDSIVNVISQALGWPEPGAWVSAWFPSLALLCIILYNVWVYIGYDIVIFLAGLSNIPKELFDAARIDGANSREVLRHIVLPLLSPTIYFLSVVAVIGTFKAFNHIYVLRTPAAAKTVDTASVVIFNTFFRSNNAGYASCMALILFILILILTLIQRRYVGRRVFYG